ncbi:hypothetical protein F5051DRAFT_423944 [Lentinula edodes]|nr:hypothetical protein F5051DRAFT_423944 [Lentinula edodes]
MHSEGSPTSATLADKKICKGLRIWTSTGNTSDINTSNSTEVSTKESSSHELVETQESSTFSSPHPPNSPTDSTVSSDNNIMATHLNESGNIELSSGKYGPRVKAAAVLSPEDLDDLYKEARQYAKSHSSNTIENVREVIAEAFPACVHRDWFRSEKVSHLTLALELKDQDNILAPPTFPFLDVLRRKFCGHNWAQVHAARRDELHMSVGGVGCFDEYLSEVEGCNNRLKGVGNYFTPPQLLTILARGIAPTLTAILSEQGVVVDEATTYKSWVTSCRDFEVRFKARLSAVDRGNRCGNCGSFANNASSNNPTAPHKCNATSDPVGHPNKRSADAPSTTGPFYMHAFSKMPEAMQKEQLPYHLGNLCFQLG